jgi:hypothetical protein
MKGLTPYSRLPWIVPLLCTLISLGALVALRDSRLAV